MLQVIPLARRSIFSGLKQYNLLSPKRCKQRRPDISHPAFWYEDYPISLVGRRQSPINILSEKCILNSKQMMFSPELVLSYPPSFCDLNIRNPKDHFYFGWRVDVPYDYGDKTVLQGGPLNHRYKLIQFHAHWGKNCSCGSEHVINNKHYSAELHFVHWNCEKFSSAREAAINKDGLAVVAVLLDAVDGENCAKLESLETICNMMTKIKYKGSPVRSIEKPLNILELLPENRSYYTYLGSLTTPPLWETVTWIVFENPVKCRQEQIDAFRQLLYYPRNEIEGLEDKYEANVEENFRPVQPLNGRNVIYVKN
ncbi:Phospholipase A2 crotoxin acid subunit CA [Tyrophagus putrescentiae]|nr:Phospholipase A2 crotoxin acid subunit CA [Tyrophagus putrescentiae]